MSNWWDRDKKYVGGSTTVSGDINKDERRRNTERDIETAKETVKKVSNSSQESLYPFLMATVFTGAVMIGRHLGGCISTVVKAGWPTDE